MLTQLVAYQLFRDFRFSHAPYVFFLYICSMNYFYYEVLVDQGNGISIALGAAQRWKNVKTARKYAKEMSKITGKEIKNMWILQHHLFRELEEPKTYKVK